MIHSYRTGYGKESGFKVAKSTINLDQIYQKEKNKLKTLDSVGEERAWYLAFFETV